MYDNLLSKEHGASVKVLALDMAGAGPISELAVSITARQNEHSRSTYVGAACRMGVVFGSVDYRVSDCRTDCVVAEPAAAKGHLFVFNSLCCLVPYLAKAEESDDSSVRDTINDSLQCCAATSERVELFNATDLFLSTVHDGDDSSVGRTVNTTLLPDRELPGVHGAWEVWGTPLWQKLEEILHRPNRLLY